MEMIVTLIWLVYNDTTLIRLELEVADALKQIKQYRLVHNI